MSVPSPVVEHQPSQISELNDGVVSKGSRLVALFSLDSDANVRRLNHVHIVESVSYGKRRFLFFELALYEIHGDSFLHR